MRVLSFVVLVAFLFLAAPSTVAAPGGSVVVAAGEGIHRYEDASGVCLEPARFMVAHDAALGRMTVVSDTPCFTPYYAMVSGCSQDASGEVHCVRETAMERVEVRLAPDGTFTLTWTGPGFYESIDGRLARVDVG